MEPTLIDGEATFEGNLKGKDARILGRFKGEIEIQGRLTLGETSKVEARVRADVVEIAGEFKGQVTARSLVLLEKARANGSFEVRVLSVREGALLDGSVNAGEALAARPAPMPAQQAAPPPTAAPKAATG